MLPTPTTLDGLLDRRITLEQPRDGYRVAIDTVFLAAAVPARAGQHILELGAGVGGAMLCLAVRVPDIHIAGIEIQPELVEIARRNIQRINMQDRLLLQQGDACTFSPQSFYDHVMMNPPYYDNRRHDQSPNPIKRTANSTGQDDLALWVMTAQKALGPTGTLTMIHSAAERESLQKILLHHFPRVERLDLIPKAQSPAKRIIFRASFGMNDLVQHQSIVLHQENGKYSDEAELVLRHAKSVNFTMVQNNNGMT